MPLHTIPKMHVWLLVSLVCLVGRGSGIQAAEARRWTPCDRTPTRPPQRRQCAAAVMEQLSRGGGGDGTDDDDDITDDRDDDVRQSQRRNIRDEAVEDMLDRPADRHVPLPSRRRRKKKSSGNFFTALAGKSVQLTSGLVTSSLKQSGRAAYYLVQPKHVDKKELFGLWRLDQQLDDGPQSVINLELTPRDVIVVVTPDGPEEHSPWMFTPAQWPAAAKVEFLLVVTRGGGARLLYKAVVHRKLAAKNVLKLKGKIYRLEKFGWRGKTVKQVCMGTFVARRRLQLEEDQDDEWGSDAEDEQIDNEEDRWDADDSGRNQREDAGGDDDIKGSEEHEEDWDTEGDQVDDDGVD